MLPFLPAALATHLVGLDLIAFGDEQLVTLADAQRGVELLARGDLDAARAALGLDDLDDAVDVADLGLALGHARLEQLLDARQAGGDVQPGDAAGVERAHGQLRAGLTDRLSGDDAHRLADADQCAGREVAAVARAAHAVA